jgi:CheY-like chemotaxis protein
MADHATILLAEDDPNDAFLAQRALTKAGLNHTLQHVSNGQQCVNYLRGESPYDDRSKYPLPNLLLLDLKMPILSGLEVLAWIHDQPRFQALPIIILTGSILPRDRERATTGGATDFQVKSVNFDDLVAIMRALDARWLTRQ